MQQMLDDEADGMNLSSQNQIWKLLRDYEVDVAEYVSITLSVVVCTLDKQ